MPDDTRIAVRIVLLDQSSRVLLFEGRDLSDGGDSVRFWFTAGGRVDEGESLTDAAERELLEETGQSGLSLVGPLHRREFDLLNHGEPPHQVEHFFATRTSDTSLSARWLDRARADSNDGVALVGSYDGTMTDLELLRHFPTVCSFQTGSARSSTSTG